MARIERTKNASRNIVFGFFLKIYQMIIPFFMRTVMIYFMGVQYLGLNSLFTSILQVLNLAELGVGSAMVFSMYKPIADDDEDTICALMRLYRIYYRVIGLGIAGVGCALMPFIPKLISGDVPDGINIYILYALNLAATVLSYWLFAYKNSLFQAHQRSDIVSKITIVTNTMQYALQIFVLVFLKNYYYYIIVSLVIQAMTNIVTAIKANQIYPNFKPRGRVSREETKKINRRIVDLFTSKIGSVIYDSADTIVISAFLGLTMLAIYQNYFYILNAITGFITIVFSACTAGIGNSIIMETKEKNMQDLNKFTFIICWIAGFCSVCLLCLYQPFMKLWVGEDLMFGFSAVICFVVYFFVRQINSLLNLYKDASGMWHEDRFRPLAAALTNLVLNLILVQFIGIYGILFSTVIAILCVGMPWLLHNLFNVIFEKKHLEVYLRHLMFYVGIVALSCVITIFVCRYLTFESNILTLVLRGVICLVLPNLLYFIIYRKTEVFKQVLILADNITNRKLHKYLKKLGM